MWPTKFFATCLALLATTCLAKIEIPKSQEPAFDETVVDLLRACYVNRVSAVGLAGYSAGSISKTLWNQKYIPVTLIDSAARTVSHGPISSISRYRLQVFVVPVVSSEAFAETLNAVKQSKWWNHMASVLIINRTTHGCSGVSKALWVAWNMDLLAANFMCLHETRGWLIYTYNPYTSKAPEPWQLEKTYAKNNNHVWTLFVRGYREGEKNCVELDFEKATDLGGYKIRTSVANLTELVLQITRDENGEERTCGFHGKIAWTLFRALNASPAILEPTFYGFVDDYGKPNGTVSEVTNRISDIGMTFWYHMNFENFTTSYPFGDTGLHILTHYRGSVSQLSKIASLIDSRSKLGVYLVCLTTVLFFACCLRRGLSSSLLYTLILICNAALPKMPNKLATRIFLASIFIFVLNIHGIYQGNLASLLTKQVDLPNVKSLEDLDKFGYTTYGPVSFVRQRAKSDAPVNYKSQYPTICLDYLLEDSRVACVYQKDVLLNHAATYQLHLSPEPVAKLHWVFMLRDNWPPEKRLNAILRRLVEADIILFLYRNELRKILLTIKANEDLKHDPSFKVLTLPDLSFAFAILAVGLLCATVCFTVEVGVAEGRVKITKARENISGKVE